MFFSNTVWTSHVKSVRLFVWCRSFEVKELIIFDKLSPKSSKSNMWAPVSWVKRRELEGPFWGVSVYDGTWHSLSRTTSVSFPQGFAPWLTIPSIGFHISLEMEDVLRLPKSTSDLSKGVHRLFLRQSLSLQTSGKVGGKKIFWQKMMLLPSNHI